MPNPTASDVHVNAALTNISVAFMQEEGSFVADRVFPIIPVPKQSDRYFVYNKGDFFRSEAQLRAPGAPSAGTGFSIDNTPSYFADVYAIHKDIDDQIRANSDAAINPDRDATLFVTQQLLLRRELTWAATFFGAASGWTGSTTGANVPGPQRVRLQSKTLTNSPMLCSGSPVIVRTSWWSELRCIACSRITPMCWTVFGTRKRAS